MKTIKVRKTHHCNLCQLDIPKGSECNSWTIFPGQWDWDGDAPVTVRVHACCYEVYEGIDTDPFDPWPQYRDEWIDTVQGIVNFGPCTHGPTQEELSEEY